MRSIGNQGDRGVPIQFTLHPGDKKRAYGESYLKWKRLRQEGTIFLNSTKLALLAAIRWIPFDCMKWEAIPIESCEGNC